MKRILTAALLALSSSVFAATLNPIQLLNPAGSTSGQAIVSTGASTAPVWGNTTASGLVAQAANTVVANATGSTAAPTAFVMPSCSASNSALQWANGTGFICGTTFAKTGNPLSQFASTTSAQLASIISDETGTGALVFGTNPSIAGATFTAAVSASYSSAAFTLNDTSGTGFPILFFNKNGTNVWGLTNNSATGALTLNRYVAGTFTDFPISVSNSTGAVTMTDGITSSPISGSTGSFTTLAASSTTGVSYASPVFYVNDSTGAGVASAFLRNGGTNEWSINNTSSGNQFAIGRYNAGTFVDNPITISNSTGQVTLGDGVVGAIAAFTSLSASGNDALFYQNSGSQSFTSGTAATVTSWTKVSDKVNANFNAATGVFTAPATGFYQVSAQLFWASAANVVGTAAEVSIVANGVTVATGGVVEATTATVTTISSVSAVVSLTSGQTIVVQGFQNSGAARTLGAAGALSFLSIARIP